jgi:hypothetical protein
MEGTRAAEDTLAVAPPELVFLHASTHNGRDLLGKLLSDPAMNYAWKAIHQRIADRGLAHQEQYQRLWGVIRYARSQARQAEARWKAGKPLPHEERASHCRKVARLAIQLGRLMEEGPLDIRVCDVLGLDEKAGDTPIIEVLAALEKRGQAEARRKPVVAKRTREIAANQFIRILADHFHHHLGGEMRVALAAIANVALDRSNESRLTADDVRRARRPQKGVRKTARKTA